MLSSHEKCKYLAGRVKEKYRGPELYRMIDEGQNRKDVDPDNLPA
jgi:hypothetical protein